MITESSAVKSAFKVTVKCDKIKMHCFVDVTNVILDLSIEALVQKMCSIAVNQNIQIVISLSMSLMHRWADSEGHARNKHKNVRYKRLIDGSNYSLIEARYCDASWD